MFKHHKLFLICFALFNCVLIAQENSEEQEIRVHLATNNPLSPIYLGKFEGTSFPSTYLSDLQKVIEFDLNYNGYCRTVPENPEKELQVRQKENGQAFHPEKWKNWGIAHVIKSIVSDKGLSVFVFSSETGSLKHFSDIPLSGDLNQDRKQIHKLSDALQKAMFGKEGIANSRLLYSVQSASSKPDGWAAEIWECDWDGHNAKQVTHDGSYCVTPIFLPANAKHASDRFIYVSYKIGQPKIYISALGEGSGKRLIDLRGNQLLPAISPHKDKIAFICDAGGRTDLFIQSLDSQGEAAKPVQLFSYPRSTQASPTFSPDGSKVAFVSDKDGTPRIYVISSTPTTKRQNPTLISKQNRESSCPSWSPDGTKLAYSAKTNGIRQIWIYDFDTREERQLTTGSGFKENPCWAKDSMHIVFNSTDTASSELYIVNLNQPEAIKITKGPGKKHYPSWGNR
jgi:TolB protein